MSRERFKVILRFLRFDNYDTILERQSTDRLAPIREVYEYLNAAFRNSYNPNRFLTVDEHMCSFRGRCSFRQYMPKKPDPYGINIFIIADSVNFYTVYRKYICGKTRLCNKPKEIVLRLSSHISSGRFGYNYFSSLSLCRKLLGDHGIRYLVL